MRISVYALPLLATAHGVAASWPGSWLWPFSGQNPEPFPQRSSSSWDSRHGHTHGPTTTSDKPKTALPSQAAKSSTSQIGTASKPVTTTTSKSVQVSGVASSGTSRLSTRRVSSESLVSSRALGSSTFSKSAVSTGKSISAIRSSGITRSASKTGPTATSSATGKCSYWLENIKHQGIAAFNPDPSTYQVFRNVKDFGAKGDGVHDDTAAINLAISSGDRCGPGTCNSSTTSPAIVYFPAGTYAVSSNIIDYYYTQLIGNPNCLPTIRATSNFTASPGGVGLIDGDPYGSTGNLEFGSTNIFWRQVRNFVIDTTRVAANTSFMAIHWPTGQATSLQNIIFNLNSQNGTQHQGVFIESGSGGFMNDLIINGGLYGLNVGNQQFTMRNLTFNNNVIAINQLWDWGWTYQNININNARIGLNMTAGAITGAQSVGSITLFDSSISNTPVGIQTAWSNSSQPPAAGSLILENVKVNNVPAIVQGAGNVTVLSGESVVTAWGQGHSYTPNGPNTFQGTIDPNSRPAGLIGPDGRYYERSKPQYEGLPLSRFISVRDFGATGDGETDDTQALQDAIYAAQTQRKVLFIDHGDYLVNFTLYIPAGSKIVGESYPVILSSGSFFNDINAPQPVVQIGGPDDYGSIEWSDTIVSTKGQQRGAVLFQYNLASPPTSPSGLWDVHARIGGFAGSDLQVSECIKTPNDNVTISILNENCIAAYTTFHVTQSGTGLYLENVWLWVADHDVEDSQLTQITVYAGRGFLDQSTNGIVWMVGTAVEHHSLYQYQFYLTQNVFAGQIQTETAYYQPNPAAPVPFPYVPALGDPTFPDATITTSNGTVIPASNGWGLRLLYTQQLYFYGAGLYSFFNNYSTNCSAIGNFESCQNRITDIVGSNHISIYNLNTVGTHYQITLDDTDVAYFEDNIDNFVNTIALFRTVP